MKNILKNLVFAILSTPVAGILAFLCAGLISIINELFDVIEQPWGFRIYFLIGFIASFFYLEYKSENE